ncbi:SOS response-associated peptidase [Devosia neptuniae]|uniref:SOS response-associated peptidase n=1 Tax=Devosia neptuniae TaxID=191302 RepID=UPI0022B0404C|nr:SOS response-associated peptidase family protein [Devosia neptuniae]MCZ4345523.1 SOS response-associated peptidase family protein [Devosia neptuniae]
MCNLYSHTSNRQAIIDFVKEVNRFHDSVGNLEPQPGIFPDYAAPIVRNTANGRELAKVRWGMPSSQFALMQSAKKRAAKLEDKGQVVDFAELLKLEPDSGTTNVRNIFDPVKGRWNQHWNRWMGVENRCVVPFTSFSEFDGTIHEGKKRGDTWFALDESRPLAFFAGIWVEGWTSVRKVKTGVETADYFGFLTSEPNDVVGAIHPKAMPVILTKPEEVEMWLSAPKDEAIQLQRPLPDGVLDIVAVGVKQDGA